MKISSMACFMVLIVAWMGSTPCHASDADSTYLAQLKAIHKVHGHGNNELFRLMGDSATELKKHWSPELARELARVFNELLNVNQNYFLVELVDPVMTARRKQFGPILDKALSDKNRKLYRQLVEMDRHEEEYGNG